MPPETPKQTPPTREDVAQNAPKPLTSSLRTFRGDIQSQVEENKLSLLTLAQKEDEKRQALRAQGLKTPEKTNSLPFFLAGAVLIALLGGAVGWGIYTSLGDETAENEPRAAQNEPISVVFAENTKEIDISTVRSPQELLGMITKELGSTKQAPGSLLELRFFAQNQGEKVFLDASSFLGAFSPSLSANFRRSLAPFFMYGSFMGAKQTPFLVLSSDSYEIARAGMLAWESSLCAELSGIFIKSDCVGGGTVPWTDDMIRNTDVRMLRDSNGHIILVYGFLGRNTIVVAQNQPTFIEILTRYFTPRPVIR